MPMHTLERGENSVFTTMLLLPLSFSIFEVLQLFAAGATREIDSEGGSPDATVVGW